MMESLNNFHCIRPAALLLVPLAIALWWIWQHRSDPLRGWREQMDLELLDALVVNRGASRRGPSRLLLAAWLIGIFAIAGPTWQLEPSPFAEDAKPLMVLLKADVSMDNPDLAPSRIERAHLKISEIALARNGQPLGLIAYAGSAHLVLPPTRDTAVVATRAAEISSSVMPAPGDRPDLAIRKSLEILVSTGGSLLILADSLGQDTDTVTASIRETGLSVQVLSINSSGSAEDESLGKNAREVGASVLSMTADNTDVAKLLRIAASPPLSRPGELGDSWQESGWYLVPILALIVAASFRRETSNSELAT